MLEKSKSKEKSCLFFTSDYHFEMITLPYIAKKIKDKNKVVVITENNLEKTVNTLLTNLILKEDEKDKILEINWKNEDSKKFKEINQYVDQEIPTTIFVKGNENYIKQINSNLQNSLNNNVVNVIDCYDLNNIQENIQQISNKYDNVLTTNKLENK